MKVNVFLKLFGLMLILIISQINSDMVENRFKQWLENHRKHFPNHQLNLAEAFNEFTKNFWDKIRQDLKYFSGRSKFRTKLNFRACEKNKSSWNGAKFPKENVTATRSRRPVYPKPPKSLDYRKLGFVTPVQDQGFICSSCYAFAAACGLEGQIAKKYGRLVPLSPQNIVDCTKNCGNYGCNGGYMSNAYNCIVKNKGIANLTSYPFTGNTQQCAYKPSMLSASAVSYTFINGDEKYLKSVLAAVGPLPVGMKGSLDSFYYYASGIYDDKECSGELDHAVCIVGYGTDDSTRPPTDYWIIKNSWSTEWGENGYFRLKMGSNLCGIQNYVVYPNIP